MGMQITTGLTSSESFGHAIHAAAAQWGKENGAGRWGRKWREATRGFAAFYLRRVREGRDLPDKPTSTQKEQGLTSDDVRTLRPALDVALREHFETVHRELSLLAMQYTPDAEFLSGRADLDDALGSLFA